MQNIQNCVKESAKLFLKKHYANHKISFNAEKNKNDTKWPTEYWKLANKKLHRERYWIVKGNYKSYQPNSKRCGLCLQEKLEIVDDPEEILFSKLKTVCSYHVRYAFQSECTHYSCMNVKELLARSMRRIWRLNDCNWTRTHNHLVHKWALSHLAKLASIFHHFLWYCL